ncbi:MAG: DUF6370 family protein [Crocinitomicaceae bacterium]|nr:DUF6370 family protein [Crocinitomicaceae bacterium]
MKILSLFSFLLILASCATTRITDNEIDKVVEVSCGTCQFGMIGESCQLAIRVDGKEYFVEGSTLQDHGDEHDAEGGMCNAVRYAHVKGSKKYGVYMVSSFELLPMDSIPQL